MKRRTLLKAVVVAPFGASRTVRVKQMTKQNEGISKDIPKNYFDALPETKAERNDTVVECANELCEARKVVSEDVIDAVVNGGRSADKVVRRAQFGVQILNEYNITNKIDVSMIEAGRRDLNEYTRYIPLVRSFNNLCTAACAVETPNPEPEQVKDFLFAATAFGLEVSLWTIGTPYKVAWGGTRYVANRTFLRFARHGCRGCIALMMSELHWVIRGSVYGEVVTENKVAFVWAQIQDLKTEAEANDYDVDLDYSYKEIQEFVEYESSVAAGPLPQENEGLIGQFIPNIELPSFNLDIPSLPELF